MICDNCKIERLITDFINNQKFCYLCEYRKRLEKIAEKRIEKIRKCRICGSQIFQDKNLKKRQRTVFCSLKCAKEGQKIVCNNHWTRRIRTNESLDYIGNIYDHTYGRKGKRKNYGI